MEARLIKQDGTKVTFEVTLEMEGSMLAMEEQIQSAVNELGKVATLEALRSFDTNGNPIMVHDVKHTAKGRSKKKVQTPYGAVEKERYVYQSSRGGQQYVPMDEHGRLLEGATPRFVKILSSKYAQMSAESVERDLAENHGRRISSHYVQQVFSVLGEVMRRRESEWEYCLPDLKAEAVFSVGLGRDGTTTRIKGAGYKQSMAGTITLYGKESKRLTTIYLGCAPESGKAGFDALLGREVDLIKRHFPQAKYIGIADGAADNWAFLEPITEVCVLDFYHAAEYVKAFSESMSATEHKKTNFWAENRHTLRHEKAGAQTVLEQMKKQVVKIQNKGKLEKAPSAITYFENHVHQMDYAQYSAMGYPIGSGVTEAACKTLIKQRLSQSGMKWTKPAVEDILLARGLLLSDGRWTQFWNKVDAFAYG